MKAMILAGGLGSRLSEETSVRPKPMVEIGGHPILWHIMKIYSSFGINDFVVCLGYKGYLIKEYFSHYLLHTSDVTIDLKNNQIDFHASRSEPWRVTLVDTGAETETGGRIKRALPYVRDDEAFCLTYGDGVADIDIARLVAFHRSHGKLATVTGIRPPGRFGSLQLEDTVVKGFTEKPLGDGGWINGGFFVLSPRIAELIAGDSTIWERQPLERLAATGELRVFRHEGFWQSMDTLRERNLLEGLWKGDNPPWRVWR
ncbi:glucose-1-phosphate cytidylyltransferase [Bradyrhizobium sp. PRIMUS42]|uniref:glucose-1-phosphate cytidylyltransferase n=1 Tax=Bradyrhizobium sp. PRIMUS42 TaxID=2908926 RepID=UPI001FF587FD|nr:glucose-1-phosphate cytidylyltransferase [Bradyrhizobium sp. PRIMUS42]MCJ9729393.1 glucose-1-phosphate cytidylyltransferase [Bradyrhizobium sp. PRIMUS42]